VFVGDTGELDRECGMRMLTDTDSSKRVRAVFLHVVSSGPDPTVPSDSYINGKPVVYFRTYVGAALKACQHGLMDAGECREVILKACDDLREQHHRALGGGSDREQKHSNGGHSREGSTAAAAAAVAATSAGSKGSGSSGSGGRFVDATFPSKWTDLQRDIEAAMKAFPGELGDIDPALLQPQRFPTPPLPRRNKPADSNSNRERPRE